MPYRAHSHVVHQVVQHDLFDAGLTERGQHSLDVAQEHPVGSDDEHALVLEREPVGVEQVGGAVERDDRLAGAGSALHDEHPGLRAADDLVLLALDGGDDVAELSGAATFERSEQGGVAAQRPGPARSAPASASCAVTTCEIPSMPASSPTPR